MSILFSIVATFYEVCLPCVGGPSVFVHMSYAHITLFAITNKLCFEICASVHICYLG